MRFKVGDKVRVIKGESHCQKIGTVCEIIRVDEFDLEMPYLAKCSDGNTYWFHESEINSLKPFTKEDLKEKSIVKYKNGKEAMFNGVRFQTIEAGKFTGFQSVALTDFDNSLKNKISDDYTIIEILEPTYSTVWIRQKDETIEVTVPDIEELLGYKIKIIKEEN